MAKKNNYFKTFCKVSRKFGSTFDREELLNLIVESAIDTMEGKAASLFLFDKKRDIFVRGAQKGLSNDYLHSKPIDARKVVEDILHGGHIAVYDATTDPHVENHEAKRKEGVASMLVVPVLVEGRAIGILALYTATPRKFTKEEIEFLTALAEQGGIAIQHARLVRRIRENTRIFHDLAASINASLDIKKIMGIMSEDIARAFDVKAVSVRLLDEDERTLKLMASYGLSDQYLKKGPVSAEKSIAEALEGKP
ncbi:MAG: GAF domain-containing protein, partial [Syntrophobacterales bacterium]